MSNQAQNTSVQQANMQNHGQINTGAMGATTQGGTHFQTFEQAIEAVIYFIQRQNPQLQSLEQFFIVHDPHQERIFKQWEYPLIFPGIDKSAFTRIHEKNQLAFRLSSDEIQLKFLISEIELTGKLPNLLRTTLPAVTSYMDKKVSPQVQFALGQISLNREVQFSASDAFDHIFRATAVDHNELNRGLVAQGIMISVQSDLVEIVNYFKEDTQTFAFSKIQFVQGIKPWCDQRRPAGQQQMMAGQPLNQPQLMGHQSFNPNGTQNMQQPMMGPNGQMTQPQMTQNPQMIQNPVMDYSLDYTKAAQNPGLKPPLGFKPHDVENQVDEIIKGCFAGGRLVYDHFERFAKQGALMKTDFSQAVNSLNCSWPLDRNDDIFSKLDLALNGRVMGKISTNDLDIYIHFSTKKSLQKLHDEILILIEERQQRGSDMIGSFKKLSSGRPTCKFQDFLDALSMSGVKLNETDAKFVQKKYHVGGEEYQYQAFVDDVTNAVRLKQQMKVVTETLEYPIIVSEAVKKRLHILAQDLQAYLTKIHKNSALSQNDFVESIGRKLDLIPAVCTERILSEMYGQIGGGASWGQLTTQEIASYFNSKSHRSVQEMKREMIKKLSQKNCTQLFERDPDYIKTKKMTFKSFTDILMKGNLNFSKLDAEFLTQFYTHGLEVNVQSFINECNGANQSVTQVQAVPVTQKPMDVDSKKTFDGFVKYIRQAKMESHLVQNFKRESIGSSAFISFPSMKKAINDTMKLKTTTVMSDKQIKQLAMTVDTDQYGDHNYHQMLTLMFGQQDFQTLINAHLQPTGIAQSPANQGASKTPKKIMTDQDLRACQDIIIMVRKDITSRGMKPEQFIESARGPSTSETTLAPAAFKKALLDACTAQIQPNLTNAVISSLIHYLVREEPARVSYNKLYQALALPDSESPLRQESIDDALSYRTQAQKQLVHTKQPLSIIELNQFMKRTDMNLSTLLQIEQSKLTGQIGLSDFENRLQNSGYIPKERNELIRAIQDSSTGLSKVSLTILHKHWKSLQPKVSLDPHSANVKYGTMDEGIRNKIQIINDYLIRNETTVESFHKKLDKNGDGNVDQKEFIDGIEGVILSGNITRSDLEAIFKAIDINGDKQLSVNEFGLFLTGDKLKRQQKISNMDATVIADVNKEIDTLFQYFDKGTGYCTAVEIHKTMQSMQPISMEQAVEMVKKVDADGDGKISKSEFQSLLAPIMLDELLAQDSDVEDMRALFKDADTDYSGFLSVDEFYLALLKMGADVTREEVISLFQEFDINQDLSLDIDEFVAIMSVGNKVNFIEAGNKQTYLKIKKARKLDKLDFLKAFSAMPLSFVPSFYQQRWLKSKKNLPSSVFKVQIDPRTLLWKDMQPVVPSELTAEQNKTENRPRLRPVKTSFGSQITIEGCEGVPLPEATADRDNIKKRVIRVGLFDNVKQDLIYNSAQVVASWTSNQEDIWTFNHKETNSLNPVMFRTTESDDLNRQDVVLVFELVVYMVQGGKTVEMSCGWAKTEIATCEKDVTKIKLQINGGSPLNNLAIGKDDIHTKRTGMKALVKMFNKNIKSSLIVSFKPLTGKGVEPDVALHLEMMPSTCLLQKKMLYFVSGYRNYAADKLLAQTQVGILKKPQGNVVMSCFPKVMDCPDMLEVVVQVWQEDVMATLTVIQKKEVALMMKKMEEFVTKLYPVFFSDGFAYSQLNATESMCGDQVKLAHRKDLVRSSLRHGAPTAKGKPSHAPETLTTFKPFNVRELQYDVWDDTEAKMDQIMKHYDQIGIISQVAQENLQPNANNRSVAAPAQSAPQQNKTTASIPIPQVK